MDTMDHTDDMDKMDKMDNGIKVGNDNSTKRSTDMKLEDRAKKKGVSANRQKFDRGIGSTTTTTTPSSSSTSTSTTTKPSSSSSTSSSSAATASLRGLQRGRTDFGQLRQKFSSSEASDKSDGENPKSAGGVRRTPERSQSVRSGSGSGSGVSGATTVAERVKAATGSGAGSRSAGSTSVVGKSHSFKSDFMSRRLSSSSSSSSNSTSAKHTHKDGGGQNGGGSGYSSSGSGVSENETEKSNRTTTTTTTPRSKKILTPSVTGSGSESESDWRQRRRRHLARDGREITTLGLDAGKEGSKPDTTSSTTATTATKISAKTAVVTASGQNNIPSSSSSKMFLDKSEDIPSSTSSSCVVSSTATTAAVAKLSSPAAASSPALSDTRKFLEALKEKKANNNDHDNDNNNGCRHEVVEKEEMISSSSSSLSSTAPRIHNLNIHTYPRSQSDLTTKERDGAATAAAAVGLSSSSSLSTTTTTNTTSDSSSLSSSRPLLPKSSSSAAAMGEAESSSSLSSSMTSITTTTSSNNSNSSNSNNNDNNFVSIFSSPPLSSSVSTPSIPTAAGRETAAATAKPSNDANKTATTPSLATTITTQSSSSTTNDAATSNTITNSPSTSATGVVRRASSFKDVSADHAQNSETRRGILKRVASLTKRDLNPPSARPTVDPQLAKILQQRRQIQGDVEEVDEEEEEEEQQMGVAAVGDAASPAIATDTVVLRRRRKSRTLSAAEEIAENVRYSKELAAEKGIDPEEDEALKRRSVADRIFFMQAKIEEVGKQTATTNSSGSRSGVSTPRSRPVSTPVTPTQQKSLDESLLTHYGSALSPRSPTTTSTASTSPSMPRSPSSPSRYNATTTTAAATTSTAATSSTAITTNDKFSNSSKSGNDVTSKSMTSDKESSRAMDTSLPSSSSKPSKENNSITEKTQTQTLTYPPSEMKNLDSSTMTSIKTSSSSSTNGNSSCCSEPLLLQSVPKLDLSGISGEAVAPVSGDQLMQKLSEIADANDAYQERRQRFQGRPRDDWRHKTQPVTLEEIEAADSLENVTSFRALIRKETSTGIFKKIEEDSAVATASHPSIKGKGEEFPQHLAPPTKHQRRPRKSRYKTLPVTAEELKAVPENTILGTDSDWEKHLQESPRDYEADSDISEEYATCLQSLAQEMEEVGDGDPSNKMSFNAVEDKKSKSASGAKRYIQRKKRERSQTMPITEEEVKSAAEIGADDHRSNGNNHSKTTASTTTATTTNGNGVRGRLPQPEVVNRSKSMDEPEDTQGPEDDQLTKLSLSEKVKLFSQPKEDEKSASKPDNPVVRRRRSRKQASRFNTQPVTTEEVEKAAASTRISPLAMSMVKPPDPEILKTLPLKDQRQLMAQHAEMCLSQSSSRSQSRSGSLVTLNSSQNSSRRGSADAGAIADKDINNSKKGILKSESSKDVSKEQEIHSILKVDSSTSSASAPSSSTTSSTTTTAAAATISETSTAVSSSLSSSSALSSSSSSASSSSSSSTTASEPKSILKRMTLEEQQQQQQQRTGNGSDEEEHKGILKTATTSNTATTNSSTTAAAASLSAKAEDNDRDLDVNSGGDRSRSNSQPSGGGILKHDTTSGGLSEHLYSNPSAKPSRGILKTTSQEKMDDMIKSALRQSSPEADDIINDDATMTSSLSSSSYSSTNAAATTTSSTLKSALKYPSSSTSNDNSNEEGSNNLICAESNASLFSQRDDGSSSATKSVSEISRKEVSSGVSDTDIGASRAVMDKVLSSSVDDTTASTTDTQKITDDDIVDKSSSVDKDGEGESESSSGELLEDTPRSRVRKKRFADRQGKNQRYRTQPAEVSAEDMTSPDSGEVTVKKKYKYEGRHRTQPITDDEMRDATANTPVTESLTPGGSIASRLNQLKASGNEEWKKRVEKKDELVVSAAEIVKRREKKALLAERPISIADRLNAIEAAKTSWKGRVEESDAKEFTVAGKLANSNVPTESPLANKVKKTAAIDTPTKSTIPVSSSPAISPTNPTKDFIARIPLPKDIVQDVNGKGEPASSSSSSTTTSSSDVKKSNSFRTRIIFQGNEEEEGGGDRVVKVEVPKVSDEMEEFFTPKPLDQIKDDIHVGIDDFNAIVVNPDQMLNTVRKARPVRKTRSRALNPLKNMAVEVKQEYTQQSQGTAEKEMKRVKKETLAKDAGFAQAALAGLASKENFKSVELRRSDSNSLVHGQRLDPFNDVMLLHVKGRRSVQTRLVEPHTKSLNAGDCFLLVTADSLVLWEGQFANIIEKAKAAEVAQFIMHKKDLGCKKASDVHTVTQARDHLGPGKLFWSTLDGDKQCQDCGPDTEDEVYESSVIRSNMVFRLEGKALLPYEEYWGVALKHDMLKRNQVLVFDFGSEFYLWQGKGVSMEQRKLSLRLARQLYEKGYDYTQAPINPVSPLRSEEQGGHALRADQRPKWSIFGKVNQDMETILFREKFTDWPDSSRLIQCKGHEADSTNNKELQELKAYDVTKMMPLSRLPVSLKLEGAHVGRGNKWEEDMQGFTKEQEIVTLEVTAWHVLEYEHFKLPVTSHGQFHDGDTYVVRWQYMICNAKTRSLKKGGSTSSHNAPGGRERCAYFFWQGNHSTINEKGASALMTVELDEERGPQVRVLEGKEPPCFLNLFGGKMVLHIGKREEPETNTQGLWRLYCLRGDYENEMYLLEVPVCVDHLRSRSSMVLLNVDTGKIYIWHGVRSPSHVRKLCRKAVEHIEQNIPLELGLNQAAKREVVEVEEGEEGEAIWKALGKKDREKYHSLIKNPSPCSPKTLRVFHMSSVNMVFEVHEQLSPCRTTEFTSAFPFLQLDLYTSIQPALFLVDCHHSVYLWQGWWPTASKDHENVHTGSAVARFNMDRKLAMETALNYCKEKNPSDPPKAYVVCAGVEPLAFTTLFPYWIVHEAIQELALEEGKSPGYVEEVSDVLYRVTQTRYTLAELQERPLPEGVDPLKLETYLHDKDFEECLEMTHEEFNRQPVWKQKQLKQLVGLF